MQAIRVSLVALVVITSIACSGDEGAVGKTGDAGPPGPRGSDGSSCTVTDDGAGTKTIECDDGTTATVSDGADGANGADGVDGDAGADGTSCTVVDNLNGTKTISCEDGTEATVSDGLQSLVASAAVPAGADCPFAGQRLQFGLDDDRDAMLDPTEVDGSALICNNACAGPALVKDFTNQGTFTTASLDQTEVTITGAPGNVNVLNLNGLGVVGGASGNTVDGTESLTFDFDGVATAVSYSVSAAGNLDGNGTVGDATVEAFGADGASLGTMPVTSVGTKDVSALFGDEPISSFVVTAAVDSYRAGSLSFTSCL